MRGVPGAGKSTLLKDIPEGYVISADKIRLLFSPVICLKNTMDYKINPSNDKQVWDFIHDIVKKRLLEGYTTIVDATHCNIQNIEYYKSFCQENDIKCTVVQFDVPLNICKERNKTRFSEFVVPDEVLDRMYENMKTPVSSWCDVITIEEFQKICNASFYARNIDAIFPLDYNKFDKIVVFGDIHGCYDPLKKYFDENPVNEKTKYIFVGDYEDRGIQNKEVFEFLLSHRKDGNFLFLKGNHTIHTLAYATNNHIISKEFRERTIKQLESIDKKELKKFCLRQGDFAYFTFCNQKVLVTHAGVDRLPTPFTNEKDIINGIGGYEASEIIDEKFRKAHPDVITVHGHRNLHEVPFDIGLETGYYNLEGKVEFGGHLRIVEFVRDSSGKLDICPMEIKNNTYRKIDSDEDLIEQLENSRFVSIRELKNGVKSYRFTRDCFYDKRWDNLNVKARGLFCRGTKTVARSFEKFFNIGERETVEQIADNFVYPVNVYQKENGYLGIVSYDKEAKELFVASKSTNEGDYASFLKFYLLNHNVCVSLYERLTNFLKGTNLSLVFEVCNCSVDPHIVEYTEPQLFLLEAFRNSLTEETFDYLTLSGIADEIGVKCKKKESVLNNKDEFLTFINNLESDDMDLHQLEGYVLEDQNHYRVKYKTKWYRFWKEVRNNFGNENYSMKEPSYPDVANKMKWLFDLMRSDDVDVEKITAECMTKNLIKQDVFNVIMFRKKMEELKGK